ncbi:uncharacterized protein LOC116267935 isoform X3 [Nymphaea colorata]|nr:uncharacterized protein LOC116267935 isoform X1 [Nymphaea colorata]XP_049931317.1 uncharacterized protein LOC116267935 isoform X2 [Nymphaea colorata]XP_049931318.1 uncharacterized protein LOC116267935 isoform X1 [Nymphaea colorata]XP_049931319.1 uncharacterized protein LOC116267935 isoform X3 [Nymphaea colorata]XP_049931320.1 uncharacterized protein LOC116267935 isoform X3 [Nymphaea colorata]
MANAALLLLIVVSFCSVSCLSRASSPPPPQPLALPPALSTTTAARSPAGALHHHRCSLSSHRPPPPPSCPEVNGNLQTRVLIEESRFISSCIIYGCLRNKLSCTFGGSESNIVLHSGHNRGTAACASSMLFLCFRLEILFFMLSFVCKIFCILKFNLLFQVSGFILLYLVQLCRY